MKRRSRILAFLLAVFMVASLIPITVVTASAAQTQTDYGKIDETAYPAADYPFAIFWNGQFMGAYALWADNNDSAVDSALERVREMTVGMPDEIEVTVLLRDNYTMQCGDNPGRDYFNNFAHIGRMVLDLNGYTFNATSSQPMLTLSPKHTSVNSHGMTVSDQFITVKNGTVNIGATSLVNCGTSSNLDNYARNKHINLEFDGVTFNSTAANSYPMMAAPSCGHLNNTLYINYEFNNCTFDITGNTANTVTLFRPHNAINHLLESSKDVSIDPVHTTVTVKGGNIKANSIDNLVLAQVNYGTDTVSFVKDESGKYTTLTVPKDYTVPATVYGVIREGGVDASANFTGAETAGNDTKTVELKRIEYVAGQDYITPYGTIPAADYDPTNYPFAIFADGSYAGRSNNWSNDGTGALAIARNQVSENGTIKKVTTQILMLRDYAIAENNNAAGDKSYTNMSHFGHTLLIDLGGHKFTTNEGPSNDDFEMLNLISRTMSSMTPPANNTIIVKNGELVPDGAPIVSCAVTNTPERMAKYTHAVRYTVLFKDVQFTLPTQNAFPIVTTGSVTNDNNHGGDHDIRFEDCVFDLSAAPSAYTLFDGTDDQKRDRVDITVNGGKIIGDLSKITLFTGDESDTFSFARSRAGLFTDLQTSVPFAGAIKTQHDGDMYYAATATEGLYTLVYKTPYEDIPQKYDPLYYPFAVFADGKFVGAYVAWMKDNCPSAMWKARDLAVNESKAPQILMRRNYTAPNVKGDPNASGIKTIPYDNNVYGNMGHFTKPLTIDLGTYSYNTQNGMPFLNIKAQAFGKTYPTEINFTIKGGKIISSKTIAMICYTQNVAARDQYYTTPQTYNINFIGTTFQIAATDGREFLQVKSAGGNTNDKALGAVWNFTMDNCTFDSTKRSSPGAYNPFIVNDSADNNNANIVINGGSFTFSNNSAITPQIAALGAHDTLKFGAYNDAYTTVVAPIANTNYDPTGVAYNTVDGGKLVFNLTNTTDTANYYTLSACTHVQGTTCQVACTVCGAYADHIYGDWTQTDTEHCKECGTCPEGDKEVTEQGEHTYDSVCDTDCNDCGYQRVAPHDYKTKTSATQHWLECSICNAEQAYTRADHAVGTNGTAANCKDLAVCGGCGASFGDLAPDNHAYVSDTWQNDGEKHWKDCECGQKVSEGTCEGGYAPTCTEKSVCSTCNLGYGELDPNNHDEVSVTWENDGEKHWQPCGCGQKVSEGTCSGGDAPTCIAKSVCSTCDLAYGELDPDNHDATGVTEWQKDNDGHWQICNCGDELNYSEHQSSAWIGENGQHCKECDTCGQAFAQGECYGGEATCGAPAVCEVCNNPYGNIDAGGHKPDGVWVSDGEKHWQTCTVDGCGAKVYETPCYGGNATCTEKAVCDECGFEYGETLPHDYDGDCDKECNSCDEGSRTGTSAHSYQNTCDATCDICREVRSITHTFANDCDATCDICFTNRSVGSHKGGAATCSKRAVCTSCGAEYGELIAHSYSTSRAYNAVKHWHECSCGSKTDEDFHTLSDTADGKKACTCGYTVNAVSPTEQTDVQKSNKTQVTTTIVLGSTVGAGGIGIALWLLLSKKTLI